MPKPNPKLSKKPELVRIAEYFVSGGAYFWSGYVVFALCDKGLGLNLWWAKLAANVCGWTINYLLQRYWVFASKTLNRHQTEVSGRYIFITLVDFVMDYLIVAGLKSAGLTPYLGQFVSAGFFTFWNYLWYRFWVFPEQFSGLAKQKLSLPKIVAHRSHGPGSYRK
jgi:putative flippase GtrA